ncbi:DUF397 domain-containing protein [Nocardiopsis kunsanensis]|uniref:DUF397 domain-containing protein n=1 Tax=Nocardiopsis kunsanensis TaxID=141693 RepID=UPI000A013A21|nr:DUF397 domain-containing protein [Nocardiopsis kunsanensis]
MKRSSYPWRKSSYSSNTGACVEVALNWHKSSYSGNGPSCVEVAEASHQVHVRDTQNRPLGHLTFSSSDWGSLLASLREGNGAG